MIPDNVVTIATGGIGSSEQVRHNARLSLFITFIHLSL